MSRSLALFVHVTSAMAIFGALGIEGAFLVQLGRAVSAAQVQAALKGFRLVRRVGPPSLAATLVSGMYLAATVWDWRGAWINVGFASLVVTAVIGATSTGPRIARLHKLLSDGDRDWARSGVCARLHDPVLWVSFTTRTAILVDIVFLMTVKPGLEASLIATGTAVAAGFLASLRTVRRRTPPVTVA